MLSARSGRVGRQIPKLSLHDGNSKDEKPSTTLEVEGDWVHQRAKQVRQYLGP
jgi:hypothetical protein